MTPAWLLTTSLLSIGADPYLPLDYALDPGSFIHLPLTKGLYSLCIKGPVSRCYPADRHALSSFGVPLELLATTRYLITSTHATLYPVPLSPFSGVLRSERQGEARSSLWPPTKVPNTMLVKISDFISQLPFCVTSWHGLHQE